jgi:two component transcriptional regulator, araC family
MGIGLAEYLIQERMRLAQSLLKNTSFSISIIASRVGYVNFSHFAKVFKQEFGVSPSEYRKMCDPQGK